MQPLLLVWVSNLRQRVGCGGGFEGWGLGERQECSSRELRRRCPAQLHTSVAPLLASKAALLRPSAACAHLCKADEASHVAARPQIFVKVWRPRVKGALA